VFWTVLNTTLCVLNCDNHRAINSVFVLQSVFCASNRESRSSERLFRKELVAANKFRGEITDSVGNRVILW
jgi:hypothetical protein